MTFLKHKKRCDFEFAISNAAICDFIPRFFCDLFAEHVAKVALILFCDLKTLAIAIAIFWDAKRSRQRFERTFLKSSCKHSVVATVRLRDPSGPKWTASGQNGSFCSMLVSRVLKSRFEIINEKSKGQQLKDKIVSALLHTFSHFSTHFQNFTPWTSLEFKA